MNDAGNTLTYPKSEFRQHADAQAIRWKMTALPATARAKAPYSRQGPTGTPSILCLPWDQSQLTLLGAARDEAPAWFAARGIHWHDSLHGGPSNHLLDSQVQCVNALWPLTFDAERTKRAFGDALPIAEALPIEDDYLLTFEYIGSADLLGEGKPGIARSRGSMCTSTDAAIRYRTPAGDIELALIEWKYTEDYRGRELSEDKQVTRRDRYRALWADPDCPLRQDVIPYDDLFVEPFYQLMRQQLLAWRMTRTHELGATRVRVLHVSPAANDGFNTSLNRASHIEASGDVLTIWKAMVIDPNTFISIDSARFCDPSREITSRDYCTRYGQ